MKSSSENCKYIMAENRILEIVLYLRSLLYNAIINLFIFKGEYFS